MVADCAMRIHADPISENLRYPPRRVGDNLW
jgi:hypothetical protein